MRFTLFFNFIFSFHEDSKRDLAKDETVKFQTAFEQTEHSLEEIGYLH